MLTDSACFLSTIEIWCDFIQMTLTSDPLLFQSLQKMFVLFHSQTFSPFKIVTVRKVLMCVEKKIVILLEVISYAISRYEFGTYFFVLKCDDSVNEY